MRGQVVGGATLSVAPEFMIARNAHPALIKNVQHLFSTPTFLKLEVHGLCKLSVLASRRAPLCHLGAPSLGLLLVLGWVSFKTDLILSSVHIHVRGKNLEPARFVFFLQKPLFSHISRFSDHPWWVCQLSRTEHFHSASLSLVLRLLHG